MIDLLECQALSTLSVEGFHCFIDPVVINYTCKEHKKQDKKWEKQDKSIIYINDQGN